MFKRHLAFRLVLALSITAAASSATGAPEPGRYPIGVVADGGVETWRPVAEHLERTFSGRTFPLVAVPPSRVRAALDAGELAFLIADPVDTAILKETGRTRPLATLRTRILHRAESHIAAAVFCADARGGISSLADLPGKRLLTTSADGLDGWLAVRRELRTLAADGDTAPAARDSAAAVVRAVLTGRADIGILPAGALELLAGQAAFSLLDLRILAAPDSRDETVTFARSTRAYPGWAFSQAEGTDTNFAEWLGQALLDMTFPAGDGTAPAPGGWTIPSDYADVLDALRDLDLLPVENPPLVDLPALFLSLLPTLAALVLIGAAGILMSRRVRRHRSLIATLGRELKEAEKERKLLVDTAGRIAREARAAAAARAGYMQQLRQEIFSPMSSVLDSNDLLLESGLSDEQKELVELVNATAQSMMTQIDNILDYTRLESDGLELNVGPFDLEELVEEVIALQTVKARDKGLEIGGLVPRDLPRRLRGDAERIRQILINLTDNAIRCTDRGEVSLRVAGQAGEEGLALEFAVADTGHGVAEPLAGQLREFLAATGDAASEARAFEGLGLLVSKHLAGLMNARLEFVANVEGGSTFKLICALEARESGGLEFQPPPELKGKRVLVVDGARIIRDVLTEHLTTLGCEVLKAANGREAGEQMRRNVELKANIDLALIARELPDRTGFELVEGLRSNFTLDQITLLLMNHRGHRADGIRIRRAGFVGEINKPPKLDQLIERLLEAIGLPAENDLLTARALGPDGAERTVGNGIRILLADDDVINQKVISRVLELRGYQVDLVGNGQDAVNAQNAVPYDLILMDTRMPLLDGLAATREIRALERETGGRVPIVALTAADAEELREDCLEAGMDDHIRKPARVEALLTKIETLLYADADPARTAGETQTAETTGTPETDPKAEIPSG